MLLLAVAFLVAYAWPILDPRLDHDVTTVLNLLAWTVWGVFVLDLLVRLVLAEDRRRYARRHWFDVLLVIVPMLRPLRLLRVLTLARVLGRTARRNLVGQVTIYVLGTAVSAIGLGSLAVLGAERGAPGANITSIGDALWWSMETVTTVGYGDRYPVTTEGRLIAVGMMLIGIAVVGAVTATVAAWLVRQLEQEASEREARRNEPPVE